jgi:hypothetical protein
LWLCGKVVRPGRERDPRAAARKEVPTVHNGFTRPCWSAYTTSSAVL